MMTGEWEDENPIAKWRHRKSKNQQDVALATDSSNSLVRDWEKGRVFPSWLKIERLAALMERDAVGLETALRKWWVSKPKPQKVPV